MTKILLVAILLPTILLFSYKTNFDIFYADSGFMWIQIQDIIRSGFSTFSYFYSGKTFDPTGEFVPFTSPFLGSFDGKFFIDFPPYFPLLSSIVSIVSEKNLAFYLFQLACIILACFFLAKTIHLIFENSLVAILSQFFFLLGTTVFTYNLVIHEYSVGLFFLYAGIYFFLKSLLKTQRQFWISGIFLGLSLFFRLEFIFVIFVLCATSFAFAKISFRNLVLFSIPFLLILGSLFFLNTHIHGHPLGFRYTLTMNDPITLNSSRAHIIFELLFGKIRGFFTQSPFLFFFGIFGIILLGKKLLQNSVLPRDFFFYFSNVSISLVLLLFFAPNHGDHISPRYLFGIYPVFFLFCLFVFFELWANANRFTKLGLTLIVFVLSFLSLREFHKTMKFISNSDEAVAAISKEIGSSKEPFLVFTDQILAKNLQTLHYSKTQFYVPKDKLVSFFQKAKLPRNQVLILSAEPNGKCLIPNAICEFREAYQEIHFYKWK